MKYVCPCGYVYDEDLGDEENGIAPGTKWEDIPDDFACPICGLGKDSFSAYRFLCRVEYVEVRFVVKSQRRRGGMECRSPMDSASSQGCHSEKGIATVPPVSFYPSRAFLLV